MTEEIGEQELDELMGNTEENDEEFQQFMSTINNYVQNPDCTLEIASAQKYDVNLDFIKSTDYTSVNYLPSLDLMHPTNFERARQVIEILQPKHVHIRLANLMEVGEFLKQLIGLVGNLDAVFSVRLAIQDAECCSLLNALGSRLHCVQGSLNLLENPKTQPLKLDFCYPYESLSVDLMQKLSRHKIDKLKVLVPDSEEEVGPQNADLFKNVNNLLIECYVWPMFNHLVDYLAKNNAVIPILTVYMDEESQDLSNFDDIYEKIHEQYQQVVDKQEPYNHVTQKLIVDKCWEVYLKGASLPSNWIQIFTSFNLFSSVKDKGASALCHEFTVKIGGEQAELILHLQIYK